MSLSEDETNEQMTFNLAAPKGRSLIIFDLTVVSEIASYCNPHDSHIKIGS